MTNNMEVSKKTAKLPFLIRRNEKAIEVEISELRSNREAIAQQLRHFVNLISQWESQKKVEGITQYAIDIYADDECETQLLHHWLIEHGINPELVNLDKAKELYTIPDYSKILTAAKAIQRIGSEIKLYYDPRSTAIEPPEVSKAEKEAIIEKHSIYIQTEETYRVYIAILTLCEYANIINLELTYQGGRNKLTKGDLLTVVPIDYKRFLDLEHPDGKTEKRRFVPKHEAFKDK